MGCRIGAAVNRPFSAMREWIRWDLHRTLSWAIAGCPYQGQSHAGSNLSLAVSFYWLLTTRWMYPLRPPIHQPFLLPDGDDLLQAVDGILTGGEGFFPVAGADGDGDADFAEVQMAGAVDEHDIMNGPLTTGFGFNLREKLGSERRVGFVDQRFGLFRPSELTDGAQEQADGAAVIVAHRFGEGVVIDGFGLKTDHGIKIGRAHV